MLTAALAAEVEAYLAAHAGERNEAGRRLVVSTLGQSAERRCPIVAVRM